MGTLSTSPEAAVSAFLDAMSAAGIDPAEPIANDLLSTGRARFQCVGDRKGRKNGWARIYLDQRPAGAFGTYKGGLTVTWASDRVGPRLSKDERAAMRARQEAAKAERAAEREASHEAVAIEAQALLAAAGPVTSHAYLDRKRIDSEGLFQKGRFLIVPMQDAAGRIWNVQRIYPDGTKLFLKGGRVEGLFWLAGNFASDCRENPLCIGEGVATMKAVRRATGHDIAAAIDSGNLEKAARSLRALWPDRPMIVCADDDAHLIHNPRIRRNIGADAARAAAAAIGARVALPPRSANHG